MKIVRTELTKLSFIVQQTQPSMNSSTFSSPLSCCDCCKSSASMLFLPYSFSSTTGLIPVRRMSSLMNVVFPAPRKPEMISIFIVCS